MTTGSVKIAGGLSEVARDYDGFFVDLWGTLHDGFELLPGGRDCLERLRGIAPVCLLSNSHRHRFVEVDRLLTMGLTPDDYDALVTAGEVCRNRLAGDLPEGCGTNFLFIGMEENAALLDGLGFGRVEQASQADFVLIGDPELDRQDLTAYREVLGEAVQRNLPLVCPNPDR
ncbi:MAG: hypothetical protein P8Q36_00895 [Alphaproteobacteria bacterium]|jgi:HAD superfamily hydrolase (TIGR01459 family)|nr:hypothetical protein [Rhodospirillaceae bacterium]MDG2479413.1 hypothetical protein [Alphaproteobacteria bacterium]MBT6202137.1 hypothetical protein [Rhodospirillaceae bacterium]MBT6512476.1 hypothetical protein [Rhodospirillaceae bacterium]MBT7613841.1 hypothetical protein [Rhodospirillaceae bacterium]